MSLFASTSGPGRCLIAAVFSTSSILMGCASASLPDLATPYPASDGLHHDIASMARRSRVLVVTFFSASCPCQAAHDARLNALADLYRSRGVEVVAVDSEADATVERDAKEARSRHYTFPILTDPQGMLARRFGAEVATYSVVLDGSGEVRFRGGIDSDWKELTAGAEPWLADAVERALSSDSGPQEEKRALGCSLRMR